jgi:enoyl-[acyl-carrier-protein] reductase (NADH)
MCGSGRDEEPSGGEALRLIQIRLATLNFEKISLARQGNLPQTPTATSSSTTRTHTRRLITLAEMANMAVFMASDQASAMTGTTVNLTMGSLDD